MARKAVGAIDTETLLLVAVAGIGVYMLTRPKTTVVSNPYGYGYPTTTTTALNQVQNNGTASIINAGASALSSIADIVSNFF